MKSHGPALCRMFLAAAVPVFTFSAGADTASRSASGPVGKPAAAVASSAPQAPAAPSAGNPAGRERDEVLQALASWIKAWNAKDVDAYLGMYARNFQPANGEARAAWERTRRQRISNKSYISVRAEAPEVTVDHDRATVRFVQVYLSDRLRDESRKTLSLVKTDGKWQIVEERSEGQAAHNARAA